MRILDRSIISRFLWNFVILFALLFCFAMAVETVIGLEKFLTAAGNGVQRGTYSNRAVGICVILAQYYGPRIFQFYQFMSGLICIAAMGFTFVQMHRARELVAVMAAGVPLRRCVWAVLGAAAVLNALLVVNQEAVLPRLAERLMMGQGELVRDDPSTFPIPLTRDRQGNLLYATKFIPGSMTETSEALIQGFLALERNGSGQLVRRITASTATWDGDRSVWVLGQGTALDRDPRAMDAVEVSSRSLPVAEFRTDLSPKVLTARHSAFFKQLLSSAELGEIAQAGAIEPSTALRMQLGRWGGLAVNLLTLVIAIPFFLHRGPANMLRQAVLCAAVAVPAIIVSAILMSAPVEGMPPMVMVALPVAVLLPAAAARLAWLPS